MKEFYKRCAELLGTEYDCEGFPYHKRTRWNNRQPGHGRYPGFGLIRVYGDIIHVNLRHPVNHNEVYNSQQEVLDFLEQIQYK